MARESVPSDDIEKWTTEGQTAEGFYIRTEQTGEYKGKPTFAIVLEDKNGVERKYRSAKILDNMLKKVPLGAYVWITFKETRKSKEGIEYKLFTVDKDVEIMIEVGEKALPF